MNKKTDKRVELLPVEINALETWLAICECHLELDEDKAHPYWQAQYETAHKYWMSTIDGKASPTVKAYIDLVIDVLDSWYDPYMSDMDLMWYEKPFLDLYRGRL